MLYKGLKRNPNAEEQKLMTRNLEKMTLKQIRTLNLTNESTKSAVKLKKLEMTATFWTNIDKRLQTSHTNTSKTTSSGTVTASSPGA